MHLILPFSRARLCLSGHALAVALLRGRNAFSVGIVVAVVRNTRFAPRNYF